MWHLLNFRNLRTDGLPSSEGPNWSKRIPALDGLRGLAILMVLMRHTVFDLRSNSKLLSPFLTAGTLTWSGVDLFFVLSGFLIGGILVDVKLSANYFKTFYIRRAYRIFPLYFLTIGLVLLKYLLFHLLRGGAWWAYFTLTQNCWYAGIPALYATWSLCVEEQFYLTIPFLIHKVRRSELVAALIAVALAAPLLRTLLYYRFPHGEAFSYMLTPCRADALCLGVLSAVLVRDPRGWRWLLTKRASLKGALIVFFAGLIFVTWHGYTAGPLMFTFGFTWIAGFYAVALLTIVSSSGSIGNDILCNKSLMRLGTLAYCTYLIHVPCLHAGRQLFAIVFRASPGASLFPGKMIGVVVALSIASLSFKFFEKPLLRMGHRYQY